MPPLSFAHRLPTLLLGVLLLTAGSAAAASLEATDARLRLLPGDLPGAGYFTLNNTGDTPVTLTGAASEAFDKVMLHQSIEEDGMANMHAVDAVEVAPESTFTFAPKGHHLMFMQRSADLSVGDSVTVELEFQQRDPLKVTFDVVSPAER
ncbi:copper chaperone PCu(A)C [Halomonas piscis]|uniref:copper chaperone PCu(A)C n=1 Tax=Halomonas piscis TaxID=3031727 RepID=UPI002896A634|nr:copper chaperone PCu(A)C [Halomonas piscis]